MNTGPIQVSCGAEQQRGVGGADPCYIAVSHVLLIWLRLRDQGGIFKFYLSSAVVGIVLAGEAAAVRELHFHLDLIGLQQCLDGW